MFVLFAFAAEASPWHSLRGHRVAEANAGFEQALAAGKATPPQTWLEYGRFLKSQNRQKEAAAALRQGLTAVEERYGPDHPLLLSILLELAQLYEQNPVPDTEDPLSLLKRAKGLAEKVYGEKSQWVPLILEAMARHVLSLTVGDAQEHLAQAIAWQEQAVALVSAEPGLKAHNHALPNLLARLGKMQRWAGHEALAVESLEQALAISISQQGPYDPLRIRLLDELGAYYLEQKLPQKALTYLLPSLAISEAVRNADHFTLVPLLNQLARCYQEMGQPQEVTPFLARALQLTENKFGALHLETARLAVTMAGNLRLAGDNSQAMALYQRALSIMEQHPNASPMEKASLQIALAKVMADVGLALSGEPFYRQGLVTMVGELGADHQEVGKGLAGYRLLIQRLDILDRAQDMLTDQDLIQEMQGRLRALGFDPGEVDGKPRQQSRLALQRYLRQMGLSMGTGTHRENLMKILEFMPPT